MLLAGLLILAISWFALPKVFVGQDVHQGLLLAFVMVTGVSLLSLVGVAMLGSWGLMYVVAGTFVGMGLRLVICLAGAIYANHFLDMSRMFVILSLMIFYLPLMGLEVAAISRYVLKNDAFAHLGDANMAEVTA